MNMHPCSVIMFFTGPNGCPQNTLLHNLSESLVLYLTHIYLDYVTICSIVCCALCAKSQVSFQEKFVYVICIHFS